MREQVASVTTLHAATPARRAFAAAAVREQIRDLLRGGSTSTRAMLGSLLRARREIAEQLARGGTEFDAFRSEQMVRAINAEIARLRFRLQSEFTRSLRTTAALGAQHAQAQAVVVLEADVPGLIGVDPTVIRFAEQNSADLVGKLTEDLRSQLNLAMRSSATGAATTADVQRKVGDVLRRADRDPGVFGKMATQIERVHRTEVARVYEGAKTVRERQVARSSPFEMFTRWIAIMDGRTRVEHRQMNGATIPVGEHFNFGAGPTWSKVSYEQAGRDGGTLGTRVMGPHDSNLGAKDAVNCRCTKGLVKGKRKAGA